MERTENSAGSVNSSFTFITYKVDSFSFNMENHLFALMHNYKIGDWVSRIAMRPPVHIKEKGLYLVTIGFMSKFIPNKEKPDVSFANIEVSLTGAFSSDGRYPKEIEDDMAKIQMPSLLMPYLRGVVTTFLCSSGYDPYIFPLLNIQELATRMLSDKEIIVLSEEEANA